MSSIGISNVPGRANNMEEKFFSELREESIHNTTRNFYSNYLNHDSQYEGTPVGEETSPRYYKSITESGRKKYGGDGETAEDFLQQLKGAGK